MNKYSIQPFIEKYTVRLLFFGLIISLMILGKDLLIPFTIAVFFTFLLLPISKKLEKWKFPKWLAIIISIIAAIAFFGALIYFFYSQVISFADDWPELKKSITEKLNSMHSYVGEKFNISKREQQTWIKNKMEESSDSGGKLVLGIFSATGALFANLALMPIYIFFLTFYRHKFKLFISLVITNGSDDHALEIINKVATVSQKYLKGIFLDVLILSVLNSTGFLLLGLQHAILFGVMAALLNIVPYVGVLIGSILPVFMALLTKDEIGYALGAAGVCVFVQFLDNNFITPYVVGSSVSVNPLAAIIGLVASALIWGIPGMVLSIPIIGMIKVVCDNIEPLKPFGFLIGQETRYKN